MPRCLLKFVVFGKNIPGKNISGKNVPQKISPEKISCGIGEISRYYTVEKISPEKISKLVSPTTYHRLVC
jgi:hypothetical protein